MWRELLTTRLAAYLDTIPKPPFLLDGQRRITSRLFVTDPQVANLVAY
jgi:hypothetical protein